MEKMLGMLGLDKELEQQVKRVMQIAKLLTDVIPPFTIQAVKMNGKDYVAILIEKRTRTQDAKKMCV